MNHQLLKNVRVDRTMNAVAAGTSDQTSSAVDLKGFDGILWIVLFGTLTAGQVTSIKGQQSSDDGSTDGYSDIEGSASAALADGDSNKMLLLDIYRPGKRYQKLVIDRGTQNAVIDGVIAIPYHAHNKPVTQGSTVSSSEVLVEPAEGTA